VKRRVENEKRRKLKLSGEKAGVAKKWRHQWRHSAKNENRHRRKAKNLAKKKESVAAAKNEISVKINRVA
jgi:hypothetical protein